MRRALASTVHYATAVRLDAREAAAILQVTETRLYRWVDEGDIPHAMIHHVPLFHRVELLEWALDNEVPISVDLYEGEPGAPLTEALVRGGADEVLDLDRIPDVLPLRPVRGPNPAGG